MERDDPSSGTGVSESAVENRPAFDVLIVGGGINGAGIARDAAMRGLKVCLLESHDWGGGTSSKSSMLAHGGLRYLEHLEFGLVHEALQDREFMFRQAPHLVRPLRFLYPILPDVASKRTVRVGLWLYDLLSRGKSVPKRAYHKPGDCLELAPGLASDGLRGGATYWDGQFRNVERFVWELVQDARHHGADCRNYTPVAKICTDGGQATGVELEDGTVIDAKIVVNAAGPWADRLLDKSAIEASTLIRGTKGIHIAVKGFLETAMIVRANDGRTFFFLPWGKWTLIGTTDTDFEGDPRDCRATSDDVTYLTEAARRYFPGADLDVHWTYAGVRPLVAQSRLTPSSVTRRHVLHDHAKDGVAGLWSLQGGKLTTYRHFSEQVVDKACQALGRKVFHATRKGTLPGGPLVPWEDYRTRSIEACVADFGLAKSLATHLVDTYGAGWRQVAGGDLGRISKKHPHVWAQVDHAVLHEDAHTVGDVVLRRTHLGFAKGGNMHVAHAIGRRMQSLLGWGEDALDAAMQAYAAEAAMFAVPQDET